MSGLEILHKRYVYGRRVRVLSQRLAALLPANSMVLDVGSGDGLIGQLIMQRRPDVDLRGVDVLLRRKPHIPVALFDGRVLPYADASFDVVMFVDVLHHTNDAVPLLVEGVRVARRAIVIKDHISERLIDTVTLRFMDWVGNARHGVALPYNYWPRRQWVDTFESLSLTVGEWIKDLPLYPFPVSWIFGRSLHFIVSLDIDLSRRTQATMRECSADRGRRQL